MAAKRSYTEAEKATALAFLSSFRGNYQKAARRTGIPWTTIRDWDKGIGSNDDIADIRQEKEGELADLFEGEVRAIFTLLDAKRKEANYYQLLSAARIASERAQALRESSAITEEDIVELFTQFEEIVRANVEDEGAKERITAGLRELAAGYGAETETEAPDGNA